jgi:hypothetical protein
LVLPFESSELRGRGKPGTGLSLPESPESSGSVRVDDGRSARVTVTVESSPSRS